MTGFMYGIRSSLKIPGSLNSPAYQEGRTGDTKIWRDMMHYYRQNIYTFIPKLQKNGQGGSIDQLINLVSPKVYKGVYCLRGMDGYHALPATVGGR